MPIENRIDFLSPLSLIPGLGPKRVAALAEEGIASVGDLMYHFPKRYIDRSTITPIGDAAKYLDETRTIVGTISRTRVERGRGQRFRMGVTDETGEIEAVWFAGGAYMRTALRKGMRVALTGKVSRYTTLQMVHPLMEPLGKEAMRPEVAFLPRYGVSSLMAEAGVRQKTLFKSIDWCLRNVKHYPAILPASIEAKKGFPPLDTCLKEMHQPTDPQRLDAFLARLRYEELYRLALTLRWSRRKLAQPGRSMRAGILVDRFVKTLPFELSEEQLAAIATLHGDAAADRRMHRLLQGDVGSGKTVVAFCACLPAINEGLQVAWMAPTEILAQQAFEVVSRWLHAIDATATLLTGSTPTEEKREIMHGLADGSIKFVVGTHALLQPGVKFGRLGMIVIDEQHRFGAQQRLALIEKSLTADALFLSATPIPQSLAKTLYGDLDFVSLRQCPAWRSRAKTHLVPAAKRSDMERFVARRIQGDEQAFYVAPRIDPGDDDENEATLTDVTTAFKELTRGAFASIPAGLVHGRLDTATRMRVMADFAQGKIKLLVSTTVIEVGVDVPRASVMIIENAERFGLGQLHQLRGRVGRGGGEAFCFLLANAPAGSPAEERLAFFSKEHDGFAIADADLRMRGPGEVIGARQSGWENLLLVDIVRDADMFREIVGEIDRLIVK